uniref:Uncharacterized protein n=1 Tax=Romanomermis culicivorax TaxID=13658 RepID=A0A915IHV1_ROMCU
MSKKEKQPVPRSISLEIIPPPMDPILSELKLNESDCSKLIDALRKGRQEKVVKKLRSLTKRLAGVTNHLKNQELKAISLVKSIENVEKSLADKKLQINGFQEFEQAATKFRDQVLGASAKSSASTMLSARITTATKMPQLSDAAVKSKDMGTTLEMKIEYNPSLKLQIPEVLTQLQEEQPIAAPIPTTLWTERAERRPYDLTDDPNSRTEAHLDSDELNLSPHESSNTGTRNSSEQLCKKLFGTSKTDEVAERAPYISADVASRTEPNLVDSYTLKKNLEQSSPSKTAAKRVTLLQQEDQTFPTTEETPEKKEREKEKKVFIKNIDSGANKSSDEVAVRAEYQTADTASRTEKELDNTDFPDDSEPTALKKSEPRVELMDKWAKIDRYVQKLKEKGAMFNQDEQIDIKAVRAEYTADDAKSRTECEISCDDGDDENSENKADIESLEKDVLREVKTILRVEKKLDGRGRRKLDDQLSQLAPMTSDKEEKMTEKVVPSSKRGEDNGKSDKLQKQSPKDSAVIGRGVEANDLVDSPSGGTTISIDEERPRRMPSSYIPSLPVKAMFEKSKPVSNRVKTSSRSGSSRCDSFRTFWPTANFWRDRSCLSLLCLLIIFLSTVYLAYRSLDALAGAYKVPIDDCQQARYLCERYQKCCFSTCGSTKWHIFRLKVFGDGGGRDESEGNDENFLENTHV